MVGNIVVAGLAWAVIPHQMSWPSWRLFTLLCAVPSLLVTISFIFMSESPKFLLCQGKHDQSLELLRNIYSRNTGDDKSNYKITQLEWVKVEEEESPGILAVIIKIFKLVLELFSGSMWKMTIVMLLIHFTLQFGYYGLWYWFPELFNKLEQFHEVYPNVTKSVCQIVSEELPEDEGDFSCDLYIPEDEVFINSFYISLSAAPGNLWTILQMDKLGRKFFLVLSMILSGAAAFLIYIVDSTVMNLVLSCIFGAVSTMGFNSLDCLSITNNIEYLQ